MVRILSLMHITLFKQACKLYKYFSNNKLKYIMLHSFAGAFDCLRKAFVKGFAIALYWLFCLMSQYSSIFLLVKMQAT